MFLNDTLLVLMYTANMMAKLPNNTTTEKFDVSTTTLSPEEKDNKFDFEDGKTNFFQLDVNLYFIIPKRSCAK